MNLNERYLKDFTSIAQKNGFYSIHFQRADSVDETFKAWYRQFLKNKFHAELKFLEKTEIKFDPSKIFPGVSTIATLLHPYLQKDTLIALKKSRYKIARYAWGKDYHKILKRKLKKVFKDFHNVRFITDSTPFPERYYARKAGAGFIGKNGMLIHPEHGSYFLLSFALFTESFPLKSGYLKNEDNIESDFEKYCRNCRRCIMACPGGALNGDGLMDSKKCISYLTIECKEKEQKEKIKRNSWIFGCDICQSVCPYNRNPVYTLDNEFSPDKVTMKIAVGDLTNLQAPDLYSLAVKRAGIIRLERNINSILP